MLRLGLRSGSSSQPLANRGSAPRQVSLGALEAEVMAVLWSVPPREISVRDLLPQLAPRAYTTVMTTLDRLFKKGLLLRRKADRAFLYKPRCSRQEWESEQAGALIENLLAAPGAHGLVLTTLVEAVGPGQEALLAELEAKIRAQRQALRGAAGAGLDRPSRRPR